MIAQERTTPPPHSILFFKRDCKRFVIVGRTVPSFRKSNEQGGSNLDPIWTRRTERSLIECMTVLNYITTPAAMLADLS
jgi:hypothetical protein